MKVPRDCNGMELARSLRRLGYEPVRQRGSHMVLTTQQGGEPHVNIPAHRPLKVGMLHAFLKDLAAHHDLTVEGLLEKLDL